MSACVNLGVNRAKSLLCSKVQRVSYRDAAAVQEKFVRAALDLKSAKQVPPARVLAFEMPPTYTCGRRERGKLASVDIENFKAGGKAEFLETQRGGQTTFHGPGQLVAYPVIDLKSFNIPVRCYVSYLEDAIIRTIGKYGIKGKKTENTGVWVSDELKIAAIGIHVRRSITSHGMALNINTDPWWFDRIVACGLPDKRTTTMEQLGVHTTVDSVYGTFCEELADILGVPVENVD